MKKWINLKCQPQNKNLRMCKTVRHVVDISKGWPARREAGPKGYREEMRYLLRGALVAGAGAGLGLSRLVTGPGAPSASWHFIPGNLEDLATARLWLCAGSAAAPELIV